MTSRDPELPAPDVPNPAQKLSRPRTNGDTVTVACKLPHGLILRVFEWEDYSEPTQNGGWRDAKRAREITDQRFVVRGTWVGSAGQAFARNNPAVAELLPGGYALTHGVPKETWDLWHEQNRNTRLVREKIVFAHEHPGTVTQSAQELRNVKTGLEPLDRDNPGERLGGIDRRLRVGLFEQDGGTSPR